MIDQRRFEALYADTVHDLRSYVVSLVHHDSNADDIVQESYLRLLTKVPGSLPDKKCKTYLYTTATNIVRDLWRSGKIVGRWVPLDTAATESEPARDSVLERIDTQKVLQSMSIMQRSLIWLAYAEGYSHREISKIVDIKEKSVKVMLFRARQRFIRTFEELNIVREREL